jgi:hypothetical protein
MRKYIHILISFLIALLQFSCISSYYSINPDQASFQLLEEPDSSVNIIAVPSMDNLLVANKTFYKKALKNDIQLVAIKIINNTDDTLQFSMNQIEVYNNYEKMELLTPEKITKTLGYNILGRSSLTALCIIGSFQFGTFTTGLINLYSPLLYATPFSGYYLIRSIQANKRFREDIENLLPVIKPLLPHQTVYGVISFKAKAVDNLMIRTK